MNICCEIVFLKPHTKYILLYRSSIFHHPLKFCIYFFIYFIFSFSLSCHPSIDLPNDASPLRCGCVFNYAADVAWRPKFCVVVVVCWFHTGLPHKQTGGILSNSLAIATDAAHLLTDFASFMISLFAIWIAGRPSTQR